MLPAGRAGSGPPPVGAPCAPPRLTFAPTGRFAVRGRVIVAALLEGLFSARTLLGSLVRSLLLLPRGQGGRSRLSSTGDRTRASLDLNRLVLGTCFPGLMHGLYRPAPAWPARHPMPALRDSLCVWGKNKKVIGQWMRASQGSESVFILPGSPNRSEIIVKSLRRASSAPGWPQESA